MLSRPQKFGIKGFLLVVFTLKCCIIICLHLVVNAESFWWIEENQFSLPSSFRSYSFSLSLLLYFIVIVSIVIYHIPLTCLILPSANIYLDIKDYKHPGYRKFLYSLEELVVSTNLVIL